MEGVISNMDDIENLNISKDLFNKSPDPVDLHVGNRIKLRRTLLKISQEKLANDVGVTFQQVQKYENGLNRVSASRLFDISRCLKCEVSFFFQDIDEQSRYSSKSSDLNNLSGYLQKDEEIIEDPMNKSETLELVKAYWKIKNLEIRKSILGLVNNISKRD